EPESAERGGAFDPVGKGRGVEWDRPAVRASQAKVGDDGRVARRRLVCGEGDSKRVGAVAENEQARFRLGERNAPQVDPIPQQRENVALHLPESPDVATLSMIERCPIR